MIYVLEARPKSLEFRIGGDGEGPEPGNLHLLSAGSTHTVPTGGEYFMRNRDQKNEVRVLVVAPRLYEGFDEEEEGEEDEEFLEPLQEG